VRRVDFQLRLQDVVALLLAEVGALSLDEVSGGGHLFDGDDAGVGVKLLRRLHLRRFGAKLSLEPGRQIANFAFFQFVFAFVLK